jgi:hypothetical protein
MFLWVVNSSSWRSRSIFQRVCHLHLRAQKQYTVAHLSIVPLFSKQ